MSEGHEMTRRDAATEEDLAPTRLSTEDLTAEGGEFLPDKEVLSILDLFVNIDLALDLAAPIDLAVAANANVAAPIDAAASANVLSFGSESAALAQQATSITQHISGEAIATATQDASLDQADDGGTGGETPAGASSEAAPSDGEQSSDGSDSDAGSTGTSVEPAAEQGTNAVQAGGPNAAVVEGAEGGLLEGPLLNVDVNVDLDADIAAPVAGAVAANANVAAPIDAAVSANIGTINSESTAIANQTAIINQDLEDVTASATAEQQADVDQ